MVLSCSLNHRIHQGPTGLRLILFRQDLAQLQAELTVRANRRVRRYCNKVLRLLQRWSHIALLNEPDQVH